MTKPLPELTRHLMELPLKSIVLPYDMVGYHVMV